MRGEAHEQLAPGAARERLLAGAPVTERRLQVAGVSTAVFEGGDGPPLLLLHGGIECGGAYWGPVLGRLAETQRVLVPDVPGLGESQPLARLDARSFSEWFAGLIARTCPEPPAVVAHSLLGGLAARFAVDHRDLLRALVVYAAPGIGTYRMPMRLRVVAIRFGVRPTERNAERFDRFALLDLDRTRWRDAEWWEAFTAYTLSRARVKHVKQTMQQLVRTGTKRVPDADLRRIAVPTALLWGRHDRMVPLGVAEEAAAGLGWPLHVVENAAHGPHFEQPEEFLRALRAALDIDDRMESRPKAEVDLGGQA